MVATMQDDKRYTLSAGSPAPLIFLVLFVVFIYGALFIGLISLSRWLIDEFQLDFFRSKGEMGDYLFFALILFGWFALAFISSAIPYYILRARHRYMLAAKTANIIVFAFFHIFTFPLILWPSVRRRSPTLRKRHMEKLKKMAKGPIMEERREERRMLTTRRHQAVR